MFANNEPAFELRLINISWLDRNKISSIRLAKDVIDIEHESNMEFYAETFSYPSIDNNLKAQLSIRIFDEATIPVQLLQDGTEVPWLKITDPNSNRKYWIENGKWKKTYRDAPSHRHAGIIKIKINDQKCTVHIHVPGFSLAEFDLLINDFRTGCWELILNDKSPFFVEKESQQGVFSDQFINNLKVFLTYVASITKLPKNELRELQVIEKYAKARPVPKTFMDIAVKGSPRNVASRGYFESFNIPENRYIAYLIFKLKMLLAHQIVVAGNIRNRLELKIFDYENRIKNFSDEYKVDPQKLNLEITREEHKLNAKRNIQKQLLVFHNLNHQHSNSTITFKFKITSKPQGYWGETSFFCKILEYNNEVLNIKKEVILSLSITFVEKKVFDVGDIIFIETVKPEPIPIRGDYKKRKIKFIKTLYPITSDKLLNLHKQKELLSMNNWIHKLSSIETTQLNNEKQVLQIRMKYLATQVQLWSTLISKYEPLHKKLSRLNSQFTNLKIIPLNHFPDSITFIQNPHYANAKSMYDKLIQNAGIEDVELNSLLKLDDYGVLDLPKIYELWCLTKMIEVITQQFNYSCDTLKKDFLNIVSHPNKSNSIKLQSKFTDINLEIIYQPVLYNKRIPDYKITLLKNNSIKLTSLILDAKFKTHYNQEDILKDLDFLISTKDYAEKNGILQLRQYHSVYILHPQRNIFKTSSTQQWSVSSYYGGDLIVGDSIPHPDHKIGAILLIPNIEDNFQRLMLMMFQYAAEEKTKYAEPNKFINYDPKPRTIDIHKLTCPLCASITTVQSRTMGRNSKGRKYILKCVDKNCGNEFIINYCNSCGNRLWKLGSYWTYHDTSPLSPYDIKCPACGVSNPYNLDVKRDS